jgi:PAS domain S-box-containing protein
MEDTGIKALLVDDEPEFVNLVKFFLEKDHGISTDSASSVIQAVSLLEEGRHDAVISDYQMPDLDGLEFLKIIRNKGSDIPFILLTGRGREDVAVEALNLGADFYVQKHGDLKAMHVELANAVRQSVEKRVALESLRRSERTYRQLIELAREGIWVIDREGITKFVNPRMAEMLGYPKEEIIGRPFYDFADESLREEAMGYLRRRISGISEEHEFDFVRRDGTPLHALIGASPILDEHGVVTGAIAVVTDISGMVGAETLLRKERDIAQQYLDVAGVIMLCIDVHGSVTLVNKRGCEVLGYEEGEIVGKNWFDNFLPERDRAEAREIFQAVLDERITIENPVTGPVLTSSGEERIIRWRNTVIRGEDGKAVQTLSSGEDVTELRLQERLLHRELEESDAVAALSTLLISPTLSVAELSKIVLTSALSLTDSEHGFVSSVDPTTRSVISHSLTGMLERGQCSVSDGKPSLEFPIGPDGRYPSLWGVPLNDRRPFFTNNPGEHESSTGLPDGHISLVNFLSVPVIYGEELVGQVSVANSCRDYDDDDLRVISRLADIFAIALQRERDLATLVTMQSRFKMFMDHVPTVTYMKGADRKYVFVNRQYEDLLDLTEDSILGRTDEELWPEQTSRQFLENDQKVFSTGAPGRFIELVPIKGKVREFLSYKFPVMDSQGGLTILGGVSADITDIKRVETALHRANEKLQILGHLTRHDALNQASVLKGWVSMAMKDASETGVGEHLEKISTAVDVLTRQLEFASEYEKIGMDAETWMCVEDVSREVFSEMQTRDVVLDVRCSEIEILVDPMFPTLVRNLVDNTLRHSGGAKRIELFCEPFPEGLRVVYRDDGVGIPNDLKEKVFERGVGSNTGLGLYLVRELLKTSEMTIEETGEPGSGVRFEMGIPEGRYRLRKG